MVRRDAQRRDGGVDLGPLPRLTGYALRRAQLSVFADFIRTVGPVGLTPAQYSALLLIEANPGCTQSAIATALGVKKANFVGLLDALDRRGLTRRIRSAADRRSHALTLTAKGEDLLRTASAAQQRHERRMMARLGAREHNCLLALLAKLTKADTPRADGGAVRRTRSVSG